MGDGGAAVQAALGVGDDVRIPAAGLLYELMDMSSRLPSQLS